MCVNEGQRALIGKVCMDRNSPENYCETTDCSLSESKQIVQSILNMASDLVKPVITPRFVPTCSRELMTGLGSLAAKHNLHIQTHLGENLRECDWVRQLEPDCKTYTSVYQKSNLLGPKTILAHCCHLEDSELEIIKEAGAGVSHCPNSNFSLKSGICNIQWLKHAGVKIGLGTDCSGGYSPSMLNTMRHVVMASNTITFGKPGSFHHPPTFPGNTWQSCSPGYGAGDWDSGGAGAGRYSSGGYERQVICLTVRWLIQCFSRRSWSNLSIWP